MWPGGPAGRGQRRAGHLQEPAWPTGLETAGRSGDCAEGRRQAGRQHFSRHPLEAVKMVVNRVAPRAVLPGFKSKPCPRQPP